MARKTARRVWPLLAGVLAFALLNNCFVGPSVPKSPSRILARAEAEAVQAQDDGKALDGSSPVGLVGQLVLSLALLPYVALAIYSASQLVTTGQAFEPFLDVNNFTFTGVFGLGEGVSVLVVFGVVLWSVLSLVFRFVGLPEGPLGLLGLTQSLSYVAAILFALASFLNGLGEDNPLKGISFGTLSASPDKLEQVASKGAKLLQRGEEEVARITAEPRAQLEGKLKEVEEQASTQISKSPVGKYKLPDVKLPDVKVPDIKVPDVKVPDVKVPDVKVPDIKLPEVKVPEVKLPAFKLPEFKLPERKAPPAPAAPAAAPAEPAPAEPAAPAEPKAADLFD